MSPPSVSPAGLGHLCAALMYCFYKNKLLVIQLCSRSPSTVLRRGTRVRREAGSWGAPPAPRKRRQGAGTAVPPQAQDTGDRKENHEGQGGHGS